MSGVSNKFWKRFIDELKSFPQLWKVGCEEYKNRHLKNEAYTALMLTLREVDPEATIDTVKKKIANFRNAYRRELKKVKKSEKLSSGADDMYVPSLWYFSDMSFLRDQEEQSDDVSISMLDDDSDKEVSLNRLDNYQSMTRTEKLNSAERI